MIRDVFNILISHSFCPEVQLFYPVLLSSLFFVWCFLKKRQWNDRQAFCKEITLIYCCDKCSDTCSHLLFWLNWIHRDTLPKPSPPSFSLSLLSFLPELLHKRDLNEHAASYPVLIPQQRQQSMLNEFRSVASQSQVNWKLVIVLTSTCAQSMLSSLKR